MTEILTKRHTGKKNLPILATFALLVLLVQRVVVMQEPLDKVKLNSENKQLCSPHDDSVSEDSVPFSTLFENANHKIAERRAWLSDKHSEGQQFGALQAESIWYMFQPVLPCFWDFEKKPSSDVRHDGGKWLCGLARAHAERARNDSPAVYGIGKKHYDKPCIVYSMGSNNQFSFEKRVREVGPGCEIHTFDPTVKETGDGKAFYDVYHGDYGFGGEDSHSGKFPIKSIGTIMKELGHSYVDYLKVDVEGFEWGFFQNVDWDTIKVGQILIELHPGKQKKPNAKEMDGIFSKLEYAGFLLISLEPVTRTNFAQVELVFMHKDWRPNGIW